MVDPYDDPKTTAAMCDAIEDAYPVTTSEQQAVPVAQKDGILRELDAWAIEHNADCDEDYIAKDDAVRYIASRLTEPTRKADRLEGVEAAVRSRALIERIAKADPREGDALIYEGEIAGEWEREARAILALTPDATQTREAELVAALEPFAEACNISSADDSESLYDTLAAEKLTWRDLRRARAALNARGGA